MLKHTLLTVGGFALIGAFVAIAVPRAAAVPGPDEDMTAIKANTKRFQEAWNKHDPKALAAFWTKDGDLVDPWGVKSAGREAVEKFFTQEHTEKGKLSGSTYENQSDTVRFVTPDVAVEDWEVVLTGLSDPDGQALGPQFHRVVIVAKREGGKWWISAARPGLPGPLAEAKPSK